MSQQSKFYVAIELARVRRISVATEDFYVATYLATTESSAAHNKARRAKAGVHDSVASCCVSTEEAIHMLEKFSKGNRHEHLLYTQHII